uniref:hypothetical protein n=1 Tax=Ruegeria arenilitoris TaxID=1173585 RepID=UPI00147AB49A|nr:hypothetical protein [Ruegeria arenilitoris]
MRLLDFKPVLAGFILLPSIGTADEAADQIAQDALPLMYHTCASVIEEADGNDEYVFDVVRKMTALSLYNRQVDIEEFASSDEEKAKLREAFLSALTEGCAGDEDALLGGVVDDAVRSTLGL